MDSYSQVILFIILIFFPVGLTLRCACKEDLRNCICIYNKKVDFKTAQQICMEKEGKLLTPPSETITSLLFNKPGQFWIGNEGDCLRREEVEPCSSRCMFISGMPNGTVTEHSCKEQVDGFMCEGIQWENCWEDRPSEVQILNNTDCRLAPCEHKCVEVPGGHMCTCFQEYRPSRKNPEHCEYRCDSAICPLNCSSDGCPECPDGFIKGEKRCIDLDECYLHYNPCEQHCRNTVGSYKCSCSERFILVNKSKCVPVINPTPLTAALVTQSVNYTLSHAAFVTPAKYIGLIPLIILVISTLIGFLYYLRKKKSDVLLKDSDALDQTPVQEAYLQL